MLRRELQHGLLPFAIAFDGDDLSLGKVEREPDSRSSTAEFDDRFRIDRAKAFHDLAKGRLSHPPSLIQDQRGQVHRVDYMAGDSVTIPLPPWVSASTSAPRSTTSTTIRTLATCTRTSLRMWWRAIAGGWATTSGF